MVSPYFSPLRRTGGISGVRRYKKFSLGRFSSERWRLSVAGKGAFPFHPLSSCWHGGTPVFSCRRVFTVETVSWSGTLRWIIWSLYSTLSSSILLLVEATRGIKSEAILTPGRPKALEVPGMSGLSSRLII